MYQLKRSSRLVKGLLILFFLSIVQSTKYVLSRFGISMQQTLSYVSEVYAAVKEEYKEFFYTVEEALKSVLPQAKEFKEEVKSLTVEQKKAIEKKAKVKFHAEFDKEFHWYKGISEGKVVGYACVDVVPGKWGPVKYMIGISPDGKVNDLVVLALSERRGRPIKERRFLDQYIGKTTAEPLRLKRDIRGIAGATITSRGVSDGIRKIIYVFNTLYTADK